MVKRRIGVTAILLTGVVAGAWTEDGASVSDRVWSTVINATVCLTVVALFEWIRARTQPAPMLDAPATKPPISDAHQLLLVAIWLVAVVVIRVLLGPIWAAAILVPLGVLGMWAFCDWRRP